MSAALMIYGATGYTGKLIVEAARKRGARPIVAGRNRARVEALARSTGLEGRPFDLSDPSRLDAGLAGVGAVLLVAGPFSATSAPMVEACLRNRVHYLDITGEIDVFEALAARDAQAKASGVVLLPGVGMDVVPSDCLAAHVKRRRPDASDLKLYLSLGDKMSRGTAKTSIEALPSGMRLRRNGRLIFVSRVETGLCDFGEGERETIQVPWGDLATAYYSTGIANIETHFVASPLVKVFFRAPGFIRTLLGTGAMQRLLKAQIDLMPEGPNEAARRVARCVIVGEARNHRGERVRSRLVTPEGYTLTALTALDAALRVAAGEVAHGFKTPSLAFGADYILGFDGVFRQDLG